MNLNRTCIEHRPDADVWNPHCRVCGVALLDGPVSAAQLCERVSSAFQQTINPTGRQRGSWIEVEEVLDETVWMWWIRPASNLLGFEAIEHNDPNPTGEELSRAFLVEMLSAPEGSSTETTPADGSTETTALPEIGTAWVRPRRSRWDRFVRWSRRNAEREFLVTAAPLVCLWAGALWVVLGNDGIAGLWSALFS